MNLCKNSYHNLVKRLHENFKCSNVYIHTCIYMDECLQICHFSFFIGQCLKIIREMLTETPDSHPYSGKKVIRFPWKI